MRRVDVGIDPYGTVRNNENLAVMELRKLISGYYTVGA